MRQVASVETALRMYLEKVELCNKDIEELFGVKSAATVIRLKKPVKTEMAKRNIPSLGGCTVNTVVAYEVWGIDPKDLERRFKKQKALAGYGNGGQENKQMGGVNDEKDSLQGI